MTFAIQFYSHISDPQVVSFQVLAEAKRILESRAASKVSKSVIRFHISYH